MEKSMTITKLYCNQKIVPNFLPEKNDNVAEISDPTIWSVFLLQTVTGSKNEEAEIFFRPAKVCFSVIRVQDNLSQESDHL